MDYFGQQSCPTNEVQKKVLYKNKPSDFINYTLNTQTLFWSKNQRKDHLAKQIMQQIKIRN